eukprot:NODE_11978_length_1254_cov_2.134871.p1 GENE.NODE_11978_length_1254_cov_2.134871~~NODE_11978_length_1254_cov_2.134871.p1  ORF type:complete len:298 (-),score=88.80 NODE_11978_length_1254_cov_2.134871:233-1126(-)
MPVEVSFDEDTGALELPASAAVKGTAPRSVFVWVRTSQQEDYCVVSMGSATDSGAFNLVSCGCEGRHLGIIGHNMDFLPDHGADRPVNDGKWHHIGATYDGHWGLRIYVDGACRAEAELALDTQGTENFFGKSNRDDLEMHFFGATRDLQIHHRALLPVEVAALFAGRQHPQGLTSEEVRPANYGTIRFRGRRAPLCCCPTRGVEVRVLVDVTSVEVFDLGGFASMAECFPLDRSKMPLRVSGEGATVTVTSCVVHELRSIWPDDPEFEAELAKKERRDARYEAAQREESEEEETLY